MQHYKPALLAICSLLGLASQAQAEAPEAQVEIYGVISDYGYENNDDLNPFAGLGGAVTVMTTTGGGHDLQFDISYRTSPSSTDYEWGFSNTVGAVHYGIGTGAGDLAVFAGAASLAGYGGEAVDDFVLAGLDSRFQLGSGAKLELQGGVMRWVAGTYEPDDPDLGFVNARVDYALGNGFALNAELGLIKSFGDIGDSTGESFQLTTYGLGLSRDLSDKTTVFASIAGFSGSWDDRPEEQADTYTLALGAQFNFANGPASDKRRLMNLDPIAWIRQDGW